MSINASKLRYADIAFMAYEVPERLRAKWLGETRHRGRIGETELYMFLV